MRKDFDVIVIGAGSGGLTASIGLAKAGKKVALIERDKIGGDCTNTGCVPSKALIHQSKLVECGKRSPNEALAQMQKTLKSFQNEETPEYIESFGITFIKGSAKFIDKCTLQVANTNYSAKKIIVSTGSHPRVIDIPGSSHANLHTSDTIFQLTSVPKNLLVIGSGPIGLELGQAFARLGSKVAIASIDSTLGKLEEPEVAKYLERQFKHDNITFMPNTVVKELTKDSATLLTTDNSEEKITTIKQDTVLLSIGRVPNLDLNLDNAKIKYTDKGIIVDSKYRTSQKHIYAIGDVSDKFKFTHVADDAARSVIKQILIPFGNFTKARVIPKVTYTQPELAQVGLSYKEAVSRYSEQSILKIVVPFNPMVDRAKIDNSEGILIIIIKRLTGKIVGARIAHANAGEMIPFFTLAIKSKITMWKLNNTIFPYPTYSLAIKKASDIFLTETLQNYKKDILNLFKKHATKIFALIFWSMLIYAFNRYKILHGLDSKTLSIMIAQFITGTFWGPVIYMVFYIFRPLILFPAVLLTTLSGVMFGFWGGFLFTFIGENISASFVYLIGRFFGKGIRFEDTILGSAIVKIKSDPFISILLARFLFFPFDLTNLACGAIKARWRSYALATAIGIIPGMSTFIALGASLENVQEFDLSMLRLNTNTLILSGLLFILSLLLAKVLRRYNTI